LLSIGISVEVKGAMVESMGILRMEERVVLWVLVAFGT